MCTKSFGRPQPTHTKKQQHETKAKELNTYFLLQAILNSWQWKIIKIK